jgi:hypothetical protein
VVVMGKRRAGGRVFVLGMVFRRASVLEIRHRSGESSACGQARIAYHTSDRSLRPLPRQITGCAGLRDPGQKRWIS